MKKKALILFMTGMLATTSLTGCGSWNGDDVALTAVSYTHLTLPTILRV